MRLTTRGTVLHVSGCLFLNTPAASVVDNLRLTNGVLFPIPVTLDVSRADVNRLAITLGSRISLLDPRDDEPLAIITGKFFSALVYEQDGNILSVEDIFTPDKVKEAIQVFGADDPAHPSVAYLRNRVQDLYLGGKVQAISAPAHFDYTALRCKEPLFSAGLFLTKSIA